MSRQMDTTKKLNELMDKLAVAMVEEVTKTKNKENMDLKLDVMKTVTGYLSMRNRAPEENEGADILKFRERLARTGAGGGSDSGDGGGDPDAPGDGEDADSGDGEDGAGEPGAEDRPDTRAA